MSQRWRSYEFSDIAEGTRNDACRASLWTRSGSGGTRDHLIARQLGGQSFSLMEATQYWKTDEVRQWLEQQDAQFPPQAGETTQSPPHQSLHTTQFPPGQCEAPSKTGEISFHEEVTCPACAHTQHLVKHSRNRSGSQRYQCTFCGEGFTPFPRQKGKMEICPEFEERMVLYHLYYTCILDSWKPF